MSVFVLDKRKKPLMPCSEKRARLLLAKGRACVHRLIPFAIRLVDREVANCAFQSVEIKLDPGSKTTGIALVRLSEKISRETGEIVTETAALNLLELTHRGRQISEALTARRQMRRRRRGNLRYREISNLVLACIPCNTHKAAQPVEVFLEKKPEVLKRVLAQVKRPLKDAAAVNSTRWALFNALKETGLPVSVATGGKTKFNRNVMGIPKTHAVDAACVGEVSAIANWQRPTLALKCTGRGSYQRTRLNAFGFPRGYLMREKSAKGFRTGDYVVATVPTGKKAGIHTGRVAIRKSGSFNIQTGREVIQGIGYKYCRILQRGDGYGYSWLPTTGEDKQLPSFLPQPDRSASPRGLLRKPDDQGWGIHRSH
jgi:hypothetical protein